jgi:hypothetical protein
MSTRQVVNIERDGEEVVIKVCFKSSTNNVNNNKRSRDKDAARTLPFCQGPSVDKAEAEEGAVSEMGFAHSGGDKRKGAHNAAS